VVEGETTLTVRFKPDTTLTFVNTAYAIQRQTPPGKLIGRKFIDFMADEEKDELLAYLNSFTIDRPVNNREIRSNQPDGTIGWRAWTHRAFFDEDGKVAQFQGVGTDITMRKRAEDALREAHQELELRVEERTRALRDEMTERNRAEEKARRTQTALAHAQRVSTVGEMATQLAHELNQPLSAVANYAESALLRLRANSQESEELVSILTSISEQAQRAGEIIRRIRGFVRKEEPKVTHVDVPAAIRGAVELFGREAQENGIAVVLMLDDNLPKARADTIQVQQVVLNLMRNGMEAMLESGRAPRRLSVHATATENGEIRVTVSNTGNVLTEEVLKKMFDPFFTTKSSGLGMGLSICRSIIDLHGGRIWATSDDISGTIFHFTLSAAEETRHDAA
jgi:PAS domain S-box-containing protein